MDADGDTKPLLIAQGPGQRQAAADMAQTCLAATLAADQGMALSLADLFLPDMAIDLPVRGFVVQEFKRIRQLQHARWGFEPLIQGADQGQVIFGINAEPFMRQSQRREGGHGYDFDRCGMKLKIAGDVLTRYRVIRGMAGEPVQGMSGKHVHPVMGAERARFQDQEIALFAGQGVDEIIHKIRIDQRRIAGNAQQGPRSGLFRRKPVTIQHILQRAAHAGNARIRTETRDRVVAGVAGRGDGNLVQGAALAKAMHDMPEQRLSCDRHQHLAGQARRTHARLDHGNDWGLIRHQPGIQLSRICRKGLRPSDGSARHSRSGSSAGTGSL